MARRARRRELPREEFTAQVEDLTHDGRGVARSAGGKVVFIAGALPGERVRYRLTRVARDADEAAVTAVEQASPDRVEPPCPHFGTCGGCALQHLAPARQVAFKLKHLLDALQRIGGLAPREVAPAVTGPVTGYRRRARLSAKLVPKKGGVLVGFRERDAPLLAAIDSCAVLDPAVGQRLRQIAAAIGSLSIAGMLPQLEVSVAGRAALVLRVLREPSGADLEALRAFGAEQGYDLYLQRGGPDTVTPLGDVGPLEFSPDGSDLRLAFGPTDFIQVNAAVSQAMVRQALDWLAPRPGDSVLELFAGLGNFTAPLARGGARVTAVEGEQALVRRGQDNLRRNGLDAHWLRADLLEPDPQAAWLRQAYDLVLLDPPRAGAQALMPILARSGARRIVYVSCHPGTLARDAALLAGGGYALARAGVLDMFPHTAHVESMALFERAG
ncbi:MAG: 23S rRNA (uracil(1939)-C(5))-methyltransferase RlmD [Nevskia sp.]|nr:23S rRNA (uracil(1939)-C(5))-methyltransferase RlmD [Nevskia sp.]